MSRFLNVTFVNVSWRSRPITKTKTNFPILVIQDFEICTIDILQ